VLVTHRLSLLSLAQRVIVLQGGKVALDGPTAKIVAQLQAAATKPVAAAGMIRC
jgi:ATP-binding cassette subfamily C protein LapB